MLEKLKKLFKGSSKKSSEKMTQERAAAQEQAEELTPGHSDRAAQIGMFTPPYAPALAGHRPRSAGAERRTELPGR